MNHTNQTIQTSDIDLIVYDFDGVMTDNHVIVFQNGTEAVIVNRADGLGVSKIKDVGINQIIISTETNLVVQRRAEKLGIPCLQCVGDKEKELQTYCSENNINLENVIYVGNDINDKKAMECVGWPICPFDAQESIKQISKLVLTKRGGDGVIRELMNLILNTKGE